MKFFRAIPAALLLIAGCASEPRHTVARTGDPLADGHAEIAQGPPKDRVLWEYRTAATAIRRGQFADAKQTLDDALLTLSGVAANDPSARKARGYFASEAKKTFRGEPYERVMAYFYRGILYWVDGEPDNARACFRNAQFQDSDAENKEYSSDYVLLDYLDGLASTKLGADGSDAYKRSVALAKAVPAPPPYNPAANVLFFVELGQGPVKYATGEYSEELRIHEGNSLARAVQIQVAGQVIRANVYDDLTWQAMTRGGRIMDHVLANKAVFKRSTDIAGDVGLIG
ncbi:MAG TPA: hypothetical protein VHH73_03995, partial [Verrucomicrobiae bacterium]|nr:hypothetical protein [Verrucomicrobiae bacterium]